MDLRIDELAQRAGTTSRNIRAHQARGLIPPPRLEGRTGFYDESHLRRLELIAHLQERGFSLQAIRQTLDAWSQGGDLTQLLGLQAMLTEPYHSEQPAVMSAAALLERFPEGAEHPELFQQAIDMGLLVAEGDDFLVPSPMLIEAGSELARAGIPMADIFDLVKGIQSAVADIAQRVVDLVGRNLVEPIAEGNATPEQAAQMVRTVDRLRPIALEVVRPFLAQEMRRVTDERLIALGGRIEGDEPAPPA